MLNASGSVVQLGCTDCQWCSPSLTQLVEAVLVQVPEPDPDIPIQVDSSFDMLLKDSSCWGKELNIILHQQFRGSLVDICCCAAGSVIEQYGENP